MTIIRIAENCYDECHIEAPYAECCYAECLYTECHYAECRYAECHFAECRCNVTTPFLCMTKRVKLASGLKKPRNGKC